MAAEEAIHNTSLNCQVEHVAHLYYELVRRAFRTTLHIVNSVMFFPRIFPRLVSVPLELESL